MGWGDEIMAAAEARAVHRETGLPVQILDRRRVPRDHELWRRLRYVVGAAHRGPMAQIVNGSGCRPYIDYANTTPQRWAYTHWRCRPGDLHFISPDVRGRGMILIEPNIKPNASPNKQWGSHRWEALVQALQPQRLAQMCAPGQPAIAGVERIETGSFFAACSVLASCRAAVLPEGGLHHAAAALGKRCVVLFGAMTRPANTGYELHRNVWVDDPDALGWRIPNRACAAAWDTITPRSVADRVESLLDLH